MEIEEKAKQLRSNFLDEYLRFKEDCVNKEIFDRDEIINLFEVMLKRI